MDLIEDSFSVMIVYKQKSQSRPAMDDFWSKLNDAIHYLNKIRKKKYPAKGWKACTNRDDREIQGDRRQPIIRFTEQQAGNTR